MYEEIGSQQGATELEDRIGDLAVQHAQADVGPTCGTDRPPSSTPTLDGTYTTTETAQQVADSGDCTTCGNDGASTIVVANGRYALHHKLPPDADPNDPSTAFSMGWAEKDPVEVGTMVVLPDRVEVRPDTNIQWGSAPSSLTVDVFRDSLTWHILDGDIGLFTQWKRVS